MKRKGSSNFETIASMTLLILFAVSIFTLIYVGKDTEARILEQNDIKANARVASSYINVKLKQNDRARSISLKPNDTDTGNELIIDHEVNGQMTYTRIYFEDGYLYESSSVIDDDKNDEQTFAIAKIDGFEIEKEDRRITTKIKYKYNGSNQEVKSIIVLRST